MKLTLYFSKIFLFSLSLILCHVCQAGTRVNIVGLFINKAVVIINGGKPKILAVGQVSDGVKLLAANSSFASLEIDGKTRQLGMGQAVSVGADFSNTIANVTLYADAQGHFFSECQVNGATLKFLLDTGATTVALNSGDAKFANINYKQGELMQLNTANGLVNAYRVNIANLKIGAITLNEVEASVVEGGSPSILLLGMSALNRLDMKRQDIALTLTKKY